MNPEGYAYIVVYSTSHALMIEKMLQKKKVTCQLVPVPRHISSDCGVCVRINAQDEKAAEQTVGESRIEISGIYI